jgi:pyrimidine and pyridine-specific 5'-nucleotidase
LEFNQKVDNRLPMEDLSSKSEELIQFFEFFDRTKVKSRMFTNAHISHGLRVAKLLSIAHFFEGITYCDYARDVTMCKPSHEMLAKAEKDAGATSSSQCFLVDDSIKKLRGGIQTRLGGLMDIVPSLAGEFSRPFAEIHEIFPQFSEESPGQRWQNLKISRHDWGFLRRWLIP